VLLGLTEQLIGRRELGARGLIWCGNILPLSVPSSERQAVIGSVRTTAEKLTRTYGLQGVNGVDFVLGRDEGGRPVPYLLEVNPRYTASMELLEWAYGLNIFDLHVRSFRGELPSFSLEDNSRRPGYCGKAIVYAREDVVLPETAGWRAKQRRDIPFPGEQIGARHPICTVLAQGESRDDCWRRLLGAADAVYRELTASDGGCRHNEERTVPKVPRSGRRSKCSCGSMSG
jgi:predicted ATP-grasp superfamily ATP-dependent carboligase